MLTTDGLQFWGFVESPSSEAQFYWSLLAIWAVLGLIALVLLLIMPAPYGRFAPRDSKSATSRRGVPSKIAWAVMESPTVWVFGLIFFLSSRKGIVPITFFLLWNCHYLYRSVLYPLRLRSRRRVPGYIVGCALLFNSINAYLQAGFLFRLAVPYPRQWLGDPRFWIGGVLFALGFATHVWADGKLRRLRSDQRSGYEIPHGGLFELVSCPNYLGELIQWVGWAVLTWSAGGLVFAWWTFANLLPRALAYQAWYRDRFADYPRERKAILPFVI